MANVWESFNKYMASVQELPEDSIEEEKIKNPFKLINSYNQYIDQEQPQERRIPQDSIEEYNNTITTTETEEPTVASSLGSTYTLEQLEKNPEFSMRAERFMEDIGKDEDIFEYLRDVNFSLSSAIVRSMQIGDWTDQAKEDYVYLQQAFDKASVGGLKQGLRMAKDLTVDLIADPLNLLALAAAPITLGSSVAARASIQIAVRQGLKKTAKAKLKHRILGKKAGESAVLQPVLYGAIEGAAWAGPHDYFLQQGDVELGLRDDIDLTSVAISTALGAGLTGIMTGSIGLFTAASPLLGRKMSKYSDEVSILNANKNKQQIIHDYDDMDWRNIFDPEFGTGEGIPIISGPDAPIITGI